MLICLEKNRTCFHHQLLECLEKGLNNEAKCILEKSKNICDLVDKTGMALLHYSTKFKNSEMTQYLIYKGCKVDAKNKSEETPLIFAVKNRDPDITQILLENNANIYVTDSNGVSIFEVAFYSRMCSGFRPLYQSSHRILEILSDKANRDFIINKASFTKVLFESNDLMKFVLVIFGSVDVIRFILENGFAVDFVEAKRARTALHCSFILGRLDSVKILIGFGAKIDTLDNTGRSVIRYYTTNFEDIDKKSEVLTFFLKNSSRLSILGKFKLTDVEYLLFFGKNKTLKTVLSCGINVDVCINQPLVQLFYSNKNRDVFDIFSELKIRFDVDEKLWYPIYLSIASRNRSPKAVEFCLKHGVHLNSTSIIAPNLAKVIHCPNIYGPPTPHDEINATEAVELILQYGVDVSDVVRHKNLFIRSLSTAHEGKLYSKVIIAHLAILAHFDRPIINDLISNDIESEKLRAYFDLCTQKLQKIKNFKLHDTFTLFGLLSEKVQRFNRKHKLVVYARSQEVNLSLKRAMKMLPSLEPYYYTILEHRVSTILDEAKLQKQTSLVIDDLTGLSSDVYYIIVQKIISYLDRQDLINLYEIDKNMRIVD